MLAGDAQSLIAERDVAHVPSGASDADARTEERANAFAAGLIMPQPLVVAALDGAVLDRDVFARLVATFQASPSAVAWRLVGLGLAEREVVEPWSRSTTEVCVNSVGEVAPGRQAALEG